ncbi:MAG: hypothetical protein ABL883_09240 [Terricaulis sp.]
MSPAQNKSSMRMIAASFVAGAGAMTLVGLVAPLAMKDGLSTREALAATAELQAQVIAPLDVEAVKAELAVSQARMEATRAATEHAMDRLERLSGR